MKERNVSVRIRVRPGKEKSNEVIKIGKNEKAEINEENIKFKNNQFSADEMFEIITLSQYNYSLNLQKAKLGRGDTRPDFWTERIILEIVILDSSIP